MSHHIAQTPPDLNSQSLTYLLQLLQSVFQLLLLQFHISSGTHPAEQYFCHFHEMNFQYLFLQNLAKKKNICFSAMSLKVVSNRSLLMKAIGMDGRIHISFFRVFTCNFLNFIRILYMYASCFFNNTWGYR